MSFMTIRFNVKVWSTGEDQVRSRREKGESGEKSQFRCFDGKEEYERTITTSGSTDESRSYVDVVLVKRTNL